VKHIRRKYIFKDSISRDALMDILERFERRAVQDIKLDDQIDADNYDNVGRYKLINKIKKAIGMAFRKDWPKANYTLDDILKPGKLWD
jgi:hypothetical protein